MFFDGQMPVGSHVKARRDLAISAIDILTNRATVKKGTHGIVRKVQSAGWFLPRYEVEWNGMLFSRTFRGIKQSDIRPVWSALGDGSWERRRDVAIGVRIGLLLLALPGLIKLAIYLLEGGKLFGLLGAFASEILAIALTAVAWIGPGLVILSLAALFVRRRVRR